MTRIASRTHLLDAPAAGSVPIRPLRSKTLETWLKEQPTTVRRWVEGTGYTAEAGKWCPIPGDDGAVQTVLHGLSAAASPWDWAGLPAELPAGSYHVEPLRGSSRAEDGRAAALGWALGGYEYRFFKEGDEKNVASLAWPETDRDAVAAAIEATFLVRDLINAPASDLGPAQLAAEAEALATRHGASCRVLVGDDLLRENYPAIHAVGRAAASDRAPRLIDFAWGDETHPKVTLVGKGVCFDSGGLDLKPASSMKLMKKDMGGGAHALGVASMVMTLNLPVRLRVLVPAVENSVSGAALRPLDVVRTRKGTTVEIGNTDAEGRVILSDALAEASSESPAVLVDFATLTGAARIALGAELPALFANDDALAEGLLASAHTESDPLWRMPLWDGYRKQIDGKVADLTNSAESPLGGAITAALFLREFVGEGIPWAHIDLMAWNTSSRPGRPEGGEAMGLRAVYACLAERYAREGHRAP